VVSKYWSKRSTAFELIDDGEETETLFVEQGLVPAIVGCIEDHPNVVVLLSMCVETVLKLFHTLTYTRDIFDIVKKNNLLDTVISVMEQNVTIEEKEVQGSEALYNLTCTTLFYFFGPLITKLTEEEKHHFMPRLFNVVWLGIAVYPRDNMSRKLASACSTILQRS
jgi:hypothetical protein